MKRIATIALFLALAMPAYADGFSRGNRCQSQACWNSEQMQWQVSLTKAQSAYSHGISKMLVKYVRLGHPQDDFVEKSFNKLNKNFTLAMRAAGRRWFIETQGYDAEHAAAMEDSIVSFSEASIDQGLINAWFFGVYQ